MATKKEITGKKVGKKVLLVIESIKYSKMFGTKEEQDAVMAKVGAYNAKNSVKAEKELISIMTADVEAKKKEVAAVAEKKATKAAGKKPTAPKEEPTPAEAEAVPSPYEIDKAVMFLLEKGYSVQKIQASPTYGTRSRGEH